ncbi:MAG: peptidoglycan editing factor PgeF [Rhodospirillales bacterium]|nr:peptidoglycan editing factor PgeF [Rhodospirillales bacterium]MCB9995440.1 peptidoglycan editing factor PgeF [Rhodospirillales bacterium]
MFVTEETLKKPSVRHGFFGRNGGTSEGIYHSLNCGLGTEDPAVPENRARVAKALGLAPDHLLSVYQIHSAQCLPVTAPWAERPQADAMVTDVPGLGLGILTADCAPVLFCGQKADGKPVIGAAHAGWGGALRGVLESTLEGMAALGAAPETICAAVGPCIGQRSYEVSDAFKLPFIEQDEAAAQFFVPSDTPGHLRFDLPGYVTRRLMLAGVPEISVNGSDTYFNEMDYFSYRRTTHRGEPDYGRQISVIVISE